MSVPRDWSSDDEDSSERFAMSLGKPMFWGASCKKRPTDPTQIVDLSNLDLNYEEWEDFIGDSAEKEHEGGWFDSCEMMGRQFQTNCSGSTIRPHTFGGGETKRNSATFRNGGESSQREAWSDDVKLNPPEHKKSFIDMIARKSGLNISYSTDAVDVDLKSVDSSNASEENEILEEVYKNSSTSSLDSDRSSPRTIACPVESCGKLVSDADLMIHFKLKHREIPLHRLMSKETLSFFVECSWIESQELATIARIIAVTDAESNERAEYFALNISKQLSEDLPSPFLWLSEIKSNLSINVYRIQANNFGNESGQVHSYIGPISKHQDRLAIFQNYEGLLIPMAAYESFKDFANGFSVTLTFQKVASL